MFAGCLKSQTGGAKELRELNLKRLHVIQMDVTSDDQVAAAVAYVSRHIPPQGICVNDLIMRRFMICTCCCCCCADIEGGTQAEGV